MRRRIVGWALGLVAMTFAAAVPAAGQADMTLLEPLPTLVEVRQSGGFDGATLSLIDDAVRAVRAESTELHRVTLRMLRLTRADQVVQEPAPGFGYPMLTMAVDPTTPVVPVELQATLSKGEAVMGEITATIREAEVGDVIDLESLDGQVVPVRIGAIVPDQQLRWSEILIGSAMVPGLEFDRPYAVVAWGTNKIPLAAAISIWTSDPEVRVLDGIGDPESDPVLPVAVVKERFGEFAVAPDTGDGVRVDPEWRNTWIVTADFPIVGETRCHRMVVPYVRAALSEVERAGLADALDRADFQIAGGCYNPRFNRGADPGFSLSRHSWGIAIDFNPTTNPYGGEPTMPQAIVEIFRRWGFSWGGTWTVPDGMHFEWFSMPLVYAASCSDLTVIPSRSTLPWALLPAGGACQ